MTISSCYRYLKDTLAYNIVYAPQYPDEDCTSLEKEFNQIEGFLNNLYRSVKSEYKLKQLEFAKKKIEEAFELYKRSEQGYKELEEGLEYIKRSQKGKAPRMDFIVDVCGNVIGMDEGKK